MEKSENRPIPERHIDTDEIPAVETAECGLDKNNDQRSGDETPTARQSPIPTSEGVQVDDERQEVQEQESKASPISSDTIASPISEESHSNSPVIPSPVECPTTPQGALLGPENTNTAILSAKTPISALLSSIQHGFLYSPSSPLSPADSYLLPGPHGMTGNKDRDGPIQPFNFALHPPSNRTFGKGMEEMALGDIGVVKVTTDHKLFTPSPLMTGDGPRHAFVDINK